MEKEEGEKKTVKIFSMLAAKKKTEKQKVKKEKHFNSKAERSNPARNENKE